MKIIIKTIDNLYEIEYNNSISTNTIIEKISELEKINAKNIVVLYNNTIIKYSVNEINLINNCYLYAIIQGVS